MEDHVYTEEGGLYVPSEWAGSPWSHTSQHGAPVNALFMRAAEQRAGEVGMNVARLTVDILKPIPMEPLSLSTEFRRRGRRMAVVDAALTRSGDDTPIATARMVTLKARDELAAVFGVSNEPMPGPESIQNNEFVAQEMRGTVPPGFHFSIELRQSGTDADAITWIRTSLDLVMGEAMTPCQRCAAISDLTTVISGRMRMSRSDRGTTNEFVMLLNIDTTLHLLREPVGEWFGFSNSFIADCNGVGVAEVTLHDEKGCLGRCVQTVISNA